MFNVPLNNLRIHLIHSSNQNRKRIQEQRDAKKQEERNRLFMEELKKQKGINNE